MEYSEWLGDFSKDYLIRMLAEKFKIGINSFKEEPVYSMMMISNTDKGLKRFIRGIIYILKL